MIDTAVLGAYECLPSGRYDGAKEIIMKNDAGKECLQPESASGLPFAPPPHPEMPLDDPFAAPPEYPPPTDEDGNEIDIY